MNFKRLKTFFNHDWLPFFINKKFIILASRFCKGKFLDIGCGNKPYYDYFRNNVSSYIGMEHPNSGADKNNIDVFGDALNLPFKDESFEVVTSFQVMEHVAEPEIMLSEMKRVCKWGGIIIITVPFQVGLHIEPWDYYRFTKYGLIHILGKHGLKIEYLAPSEIALWGTFALKICDKIRKICKDSRCLRLGFFPLFFFLQFFSIILDKLLLFEEDTGGYNAITRKAQF